MTHNSTLPVKATSTTFRIIDVLLEEDYVGVSELATRLDLSKSTVHSHLTTLQQLGYVTRDENGSRISLQFFQVGEQVRDQHPLYVHGRADISQLASTTGFNTGIIVHEGSDGFCLYSRSGRDSDPLIREGSRYPLHVTGAGKAILAALPTTEVDAYLEESPLEKFTPETITDPERLRNELQTIASRGLAYEKGEIIDDVRSIGTEITDADGVVLGAIFLSGTRDNLSGKQFSQNNAGLLVSVSNLIENKLQSQPTK